MLRDMTTAAYQPSPGSPNSLPLAELQDTPLDVHSVQGQLVRMGNNLDNLSKAIQMLYEATSSYHRPPTEPSGRALQPAVDGTSARHDLLSSLNDQLEAEVDRLQSLYHRLDL